MKTYSLIAIILALGATVSCWNLRLERICEAGEPSGTNHTLVYANTFLSCASACDFNPRCFFLSFYGTDCVMYEDVSPCNGTHAGPMRDAYQVASTCQPGWQHFGGSCYFVVQEELMWSMSKTECGALGSLLVTINTEAEGEFLTQLLLTAGFPNTTAWTGATYDGSVWGWISSEPLGYQDWKLGEPANAIAWSSVVAIDSDDGKWQVADRIGTTKIGVCEKSL